MTLLLRLPEVPVTVTVAVPATAAAVVPSVNVGGLALPT